MQGSPILGPLSPVRGPRLGSQYVDQQLVNVVGIPLLILASVAIIFILVQGKDILQPLCIAVFFSYLLRPLINLLTTPFDRCLQLCRKKRSRARPKRPRSSTARPSYGGNTTDSEHDEHVGLLTPQANARGPRTPGGNVRLAPRRRRKPRGLKINLYCCSCTITHLPRPLAVIFSIIIVLSTIGFGVLMIADAIQTFENESLIVYEQQAIKLRDQVLTWTKANFNVDGTYLLRQLSAQISLSAVFKSLFLFLFDMITGMFLVMLFIIYLLFEKDPHQYGANSIRGKIDRQITHYITLKTLISLLAGGLVYIILGPMLRVRMANLFSVLTFLLNFIPNVGPIIATFVPLPVVLFDPNLDSMAMMLAFILPSVVHFVVGNFIEPSLFGSQLEMHPVFLLLSLAFWYAVWGVPGAILSVPMTAVLRICLTYSSHPFAVITVHLMQGNMSNIFGDPDDDGDELDSSQTTPADSDADDGGVADTPTSTTVLQVGDIADDAGDVQLKTGV